MPPAPDYQRRLSRISRLSEDAFHSVVESRASRKRITRFTNEESSVENSKTDIEKCGIPEIQIGDAKPQRSEESKFSCFQACALNTMNMFGTGPLITIPYCIAAVTPYGPYCMIGYALAVLACMCDSLIWGELGSMWPVTGGSHTYLRKLYRGTLGDFMSFMYFWQFIISGPAEIASGCIAIAEYLVYFSPETVTYTYRVMISLGILSVSVFLLYRSVSDAGNTAIILWLFTIGAMVATIGLGMWGWDVENLKNTVRSKNRNLVIFE